MVALGCHTVASRDSGKCRKKNRSETGGATMSERRSNLGREKTEPQEAASQPQRGTQAVRQQMIPEDALAAGAQRIYKARTATQRAEAGTGQ